MTYCTERSSALGVAVDNLAAGCKRRGSDDQQKRWTVAHSTIVVTCLEAVKCWSGQNLALEQGVCYACTQSNSLQVLDCEEAVHVSTTQKP